MPIQSGRWLCVDAGRWFSSYPWVEAIFISSLWGLSGIGALALCIGLRRPGPWYRVAGACWSVSGIVLIVFGAINYFSHIGPIVETMLETDWTPSERWPTERALSRERISAFGATC